MHFMAEKNVLILRRGIDIREGQHQNNEKQNRIYSVGVSPSSVENRVYGMMMIAANANTANMLITQTG